MIEPKLSSNSTRSVPFPEVTVILGDPRLLDASKVNHCFSPEDLKAVSRLKAALGELPEYRFRYLDNHRTLLTDLLTDPPGFVFNLGDTGFCNDAARELHLPAFLELLGVSYSGNGPACLGLCYNKAHVRAIAKDHGVPVPYEQYVPGTAVREARPSIFPALIKPATGDGSLGITQRAVVKDIDEARNYLNFMACELPGRDVLIQEFLSGAEYSVALIGNPGLEFTILPPMMVDYRHLDSALPPILSYESKTMPDSPYWADIKYQQAPLDAPTRQQLTDLSTRLFAYLGCRDYVRFDFRADAKGEIKLLEVNPNPAWCWDGKMNFMAGFAGLSYSDVLALILKTAQARAASK